MMWGIVLSIMDLVRSLKKQKKKDITKPTGLTCKKYVLMPVKWFENLAKFPFFKKWILGIQLLGGRFWKTVLYYQLQLNITNDQEILIPDIYISIRYTYKGRTKRYKVHLEWYYKIRVQDGKQICPAKVNKLWHIHTMRYYTVIKINYC